MLYPFKTKDFLSIVASMVNQLRGTQKQVTDFRIGSPPRTIVEASAIEIDELYQNMVGGLLQAIPASLYQTFDFNQLPEVFANGTLTFTIPAALANDYQIAQGLQAQLADQSETYQTIAAAVIPAGSTSVNTRAVCTVSGTEGNCPTGAINTVVGGDGSLSVTNAAPFANGAAAETLDQRRLRFLDFIESLSRGPVGSIEYGVKRAQVLAADGSVIERVTDAAAVELYRVRPTSPTGLVTVYIFNGNDGASPDLIAAAQQIVDGMTDAMGNVTIGYKAAGIPAPVLAAALQRVDRNLNIRTANGQITAAQSAALLADLYAAFLPVPIGGTLYERNIVNIGTSQAGIFDVREVDFTGDAVAAPGAKLVPGTINLIGVQ